VEELNSEYSQFSINIGDIADISKSVVSPINGKFKLATPNFLNDSPLNLNQFSPNKETIIGADSSIRSRFSELIPLNPVDDLGQVVRSSNQLDVPSQTINNSTITNNSTQNLSTQNSIFNQQTSALNNSLATTNLISNALVSAIDKVTTGDRLVTNTNELITLMSDRLVTNNFEKEATNQASTNQLLNQLNSTLNKVTNQVESINSINQTLNQVKSNSASSDLNTLTTVNSNLINSVTKLENFRENNATSSNQNESQTLINQNLINLEKLEKTIVNSTSPTLNQIEPSAQLNTIESITSNNSKINQTTKESDQMISVNRTNSTLIKEPGAAINNSQTSNNSKSNSSTNSTNQSSSQISVSETSLNQVANSSNLNQSTNSNSSNSSPVMPPAAPIVNIDISQLATAITRLERILLGGIDVTLKET
jgi:hypothetical protein